MPSSCPLGLQCAGRARFDSGRSGTSGAITGSVFISMSFHDLLMKLLPTNGTFS